MTIAKKICAFALGALFIAGGIAHFMNPALSDGFIPEFLSKTLVHYIIGVLELAVGIGAFIPKWRNKALLGILILLSGFLVLHINDVFQENPVIGSHTAAVIRIPVQLLFMFMAWFGREKA